MIRRELVHDHDALRAKPSYVLVPAIEYGMVVGR